MNRPRVMPHDEIHIKGPLASRAAGAGRSKGLTSQKPESGLKLSRRKIEFRERGWMDGDTLRSSLEPMSR